MTSVPTKRTASESIKAQTSPKIPHSHALKRTAASAQLPLQTQPHPQVALSTPHITPQHPPAFHTAYPFATQHFPIRFKPADASSTMAAAVAAAAAGASAVPTPGPAPFIPQLSYMEGQFATHALILDQQRRIKALETELAQSQLELMRLRAAMHATTDQQSNGVSHDEVVGSSNGSAAMNERQTAEDRKKVSSRYWTADEHARFLEGLELFGQKDIKSISRHVGTRSATQVRTHAQKYYLRIERERAKAEGSTPPPCSRDSRSNQKGRPRGRGPELGLCGADVRVGGRASVDSQSAESGSLNGTVNRSSSSVEKTSGGESGDINEKLGLVFHPYRKNTHGEFDAHEGDQSGKTKNVISPDAEPDTANAHNSQSFAAAGMMLSKRGTKLHANNKDGTYTAPSKVETKRDSAEGVTEGNENDHKKVKNEEAVKLDNFPVASDNGKGDADELRTKSNIHIKGEQVLPTTLNAVGSGNSGNSADESLAACPTGEPLTHDFVPKKKRTGDETEVNINNKGAKRIKLEPEEDNDPSNDVMIKLSVTEGGGEIAESGGLVRSHLPPRFGERVLNGLIESGGSVSNLRNLLPAGGLDGVVGCKVATLRRNGSSSSVLADLSKNVGVLSRSNSFLLPSNGKGVTRTNSILSLLSGIPTAMRESPSTDRLLGLDIGDDKLMLASLKETEMDGEENRSHDVSGDSGSQDENDGDPNEVRSRVGAGINVSSEGGASVGTLGDRSFSFGQLNHMGVDDLEDAGAVALSIPDDHKWNDG